MSFFISRSRVFLILCNLLDPDKFGSLPWIFCCVVFKCLKRFVAAAANWRRLNYVASQCFVLKISVYLHSINDTFEIISLVPQLVDSFLQLYFIVGQWPSLRIVLGIGPSASITVVSYPNFLAEISMNDFLRISASELIMTLR